MRVLPDRYSQPTPAVIKKNAARVKHLGAPLKGLDLSSKLIEGDPLKAPILDNWVIEENQIKARAGTKLTVAFASATPVSCLIPYYGGVNRMAAAINHEIRLLDNTLVKGGFTSDDWHWTSFSNLAAAEYTVMVNGSDGVWSWDGGIVSTDPAPVAVTNLSKSNPAVCTVAAGDIAKFSNGMVVTIAGATGTGLINANGPQVIGSVGAPANTFTLLTVDTSSAAAPQTSGVTADPPGTGIVKETVTAPAGEPWIVPNQFNIVLSHMNRLWFADSSNLAVYYLPIQQKSGEVTPLPLNAVFRRGGNIRAMATWTVDGGAGLDDQLVIFSSNGECVIYSGLDPDDPTGFSLVGIFSFDSPMSKHSVVHYGGELYCLISSGLVPMSTLMRAESEQLGQSDRNVYSAFFQTSLAYRGLTGWQALLIHTSGRLICNMPLGSTNMYRQMVRFMPSPIWSSWSGLPARCFGWIDNTVYFGSDDGKVYELHPNYLNDNGQPIRLDLQMAWSSYGTPALKHFKMVLPYITTNGTPKPYIDMRVDYDTTLPANQPETSFGITGATWDLATWDVDYWASGPRTGTTITGVGVLGHVGAVRLTASILNCTFAVSGFDVIWESGAVFG